MAPRRTKRRKRRSKKNGGSNQERSNNERSNNEPITEEERRRRIDEETIRMTRMYEEETQMKAWLEESVPNLNCRHYSNLAMHNMMNCVKLSHEDPPQPMASRYYELAIENAEKVLQIKSLDNSKLEFLLNTPNMGVPGHWRAEAIRLQRSYISDCKSGEIKRIYSELKNSQYGEEWDRRMKALYAHLETLLPDY